MVEKQQQSETIFSGIEGNKENMEMGKTFMDVLNKLKTVGVVDGGGPISFPLNDKDKQQGVMSVEIDYIMLDNLSRQPVSDWNGYTHTITVKKGYSDGRKSSVRISAEYGSNKKSGENLIEFRVGSSYQIVGEDGEFNTKNIVPSLVNNEELKKQTFVLESRINDRKNYLQQKNQENQKIRQGYLDKMQELSDNDSNGIDEEYQEKINSV